MKSILIFHHIACEGPGYLGDYLTSRDVPFNTIRVDKGEDVPEDPTAYSGLVFMGGPMSVNEPVPWIEKELKLICKAYQKNIPILGHCLGGQLISKALGGEITSNHVTEMGWYPVRVVENSCSNDWLKGLPEQFEVFHWHGETFSLPDDAIPLLRNEFCKNQAFVIGNSLALQCHVEMKNNTIQEWLEFYENEMPKPSSSVQSREQMLENLQERIRSSKTIADVLYTKWREGLDR